MKVLYRDRGHTIQGLPAVSLDSFDKLLSGARGWICENGTKNSLTAYVCTKGGNEKILVFKIKELQSYLRRIKYSRMASYQAKYANDPNSRHD